MVIAPAPPAVRVVVGVVVVIVGHTRDKEAAMMVVVLMREVVGVEGCPGTEARYTSELHARSTRAAEMHAHRPATMMSERD